MKNLHPENSSYNNRQQERGSVLFYILIGVVLFAALSYTVSGMMRGGNTDMIGEEQAKLYASEILDYARVIRQAMQNVRISNGCQDTEIRFVNNVTTGYGASVRPACDIFDPAGGDARYVPPIDKWGAGTEWIFSGRTPVLGIGTNDGTPNASDLTIVLSDINLSVCKEINNKSGIQNPSDNPPIDVGSMDASTKFTGTYNTASEYNAPEINGKMYGCLQNAAQTSNIFYQVLIAR